MIRIKSNWCIVFINCKYSVGYIRRY